MSKLKLAIIGHGFVGKGVSYGFDTENVEQFIVDPVGGLEIDDLVDKNIDISFICVPTPMGEDGSINSSIVEQVVVDIINLEISGHIVLKSTVTPDIVDRLSKLTDRFIYNPEFLTERNYKHDFENPIMHVFGGELAKCEQVKEIYDQYSKCKPCKVHYMTAPEASFVKYGINSFLATKVSWFNQYYELVNKFGADYDVVRSAIGTDARVALSHTQVPGPDGRFGFSGSCFPKDTFAVYKYSIMQNSKLDIVKSAIEYNQLVRAEGGLDEREVVQKVRFDLEL